MAEVNKCIKGLHKAVDRQNRELSVEKQPRFIELWGWTTADTQNAFVETPHESFRIAPPHPSYREYKATDSRGRRTKMDSLYL